MSKIFSDYQNVVYFHYNELSNAIIKFEKYKMDFFVDRKECAIYFNEDDVYDEYEFRNEVVDTWKENPDYKTKKNMSKEIIIVNTPLQDENTLNKQCINGEYPNWCARTEGTKVGETFQDWWKRKQEWMGDKILGIYLYDIEPIGGIIGKPNEAALFIRYDYIKQKDEELPIADRGCCSECGEGYDNEPEWLYNTECELCGHPIPEHIIVKKS